MSELCINVKPYPQPRPRKNPAGDCFACALTAGLRHLFPDSYPDFNTVFDYFLVPMSGGGKTISNTWYGIQKAFTAAIEDGYSLESKVEILLPDFELDKWSYTFYRCYPSAERYNNRLEEMLKDGWIALQSINYDGKGAINTNGTINDSDHFVVVDGVKEQQETLSECCDILQHYVHVVCSVKGGYWIKTADFMLKHGASAWLFIRRK